MKIEELILYAREKNASDIHISEGLPLFFRINGELQEMSVYITSQEVRELILSMLSDEQKALIEKKQDVDFAIKTKDGNRQRVNVFSQQKKLAATIRLLNSKIPSLESLNLPKALGELAEEKRGLILITGPTGSGKSTTLAAMINHINTKFANHIITIEDPIEYQYESDKSIIHQRELGEDTNSFASALRSALREDPDVILVGEMRDYETISAAVTAAETGHLVLATLHTTGAAQTLDRIIDACPTDSQGQVRTMLSMVLKGVVTQCLIPMCNTQGRVAATEILLCNDAAANLIRDNKCHQLNSVMQSSRKIGMHTLNADLFRLVEEGKITKEKAMECSNDKKDFQGYIL